MTLTQLDCALHSCLGEHVHLYLRTDGQQGVFLRFSGRLYHAQRQPREGGSLRFCVDTGASATINFSVMSVASISDDRTQIHLKP